MGKVKEHELICDLTQCHCVDTKEFNLHVNFSCSKTTTAMQTFSCFLYNFTSVEFKYWLKNQC